MRPGSFTLQAYSAGVATARTSPAGLAIGLAGLAAFASGRAASRMYAQVFGAVLAVVAVLGIVVSNPLGLLPIGGYDVFLHAGSALVLLYVGFAGSSRETAAA